MNKLIAFFLSLLIGSTALAQPFTGVGASTYRIISVNNNTGVLVADQKRVLYSVVAYNINAAVRYLKLYNKATAPTCGTDTPIATIPLAASAAPGGSIPLGDAGWQFPLGLGYCIVTGAADSDTTAPAANEQFVTLGYN